MKIYPAIDIKSGQCVRLYQGSYEQITTYATDPLEIAQQYAAAGAQYLHIVDLDGAQRAQPINANLIIKIAKTTNLSIQTGGGIRNAEQIKNYLDQGIKRVILGSIAVKQQALVKEFIKTFGADKIVLALDLRFTPDNIPMLFVHGWQKKSGISLWELLTEYKSVGVKHILCTDINCDGTLIGPNIHLYSQCVAHYPEIQWQASGGVSQLNDLDKLANIPVAGVIIGKALYENKFSLSDALNGINLC